MAHQVPALTTFLLPGYSHGMAHQVPTLTTFLLPHHRQHHWFLGLPLTSLSPSTRLPPPTSTGRHSAPAHTHTELPGTRLRWPFLCFSSMTAAICPCPLPAVHRVPLYSSSCGAARPLLPSSRPAVPCWPSLQVWTRILSCSFAALAVLGLPHHSSSIRSSHNYHFHYPAPISFSLSCSYSTKALCMICLSAPAEGNIFSH